MSISSSTFVHKYSKQKIKILEKEPDYEDFRLVNFELYDQGWSMISSFTCKTDINNIEKIKTVMINNNWELNLVE